MSNAVSNSSYRRRNRRGGAGKTSHQQRNILLKSVRYAPPATPEKASRILSIPKTQPLRIIFLSLHTFNYMLLFTYGLVMQRTDLWSASAHSTTTSRAACFIFAADSRQQRTASGITATTNFSLGELKPDRTLLIHRRRGAFAALDTCEYQKEICYSYRNRREAKSN